jgi:DNA-binding CsgD family transcriptional regulator
LNHEKRHLRRTLAPPDGFWCGWLVPRRLASRRLSMTDEARLSAREYEVLLLIVEGMNNVEIAAQLGTSRRTIQSHVSSALRKTGTRSRTQLAVAALRRGLVPMQHDDA